MDPSWVMDLILLNPDGFIQPKQGDSPAKNGESPLETDGSQKRLKLKGCPSGAKKTKFGPGVTYIYISSFKSVKVW